MPETTRIVDCALDALLVVDEHQLIVDLNPAAERMFGMERDEVIGLDMNELIVPPETRDAQRAAFDRATLGDDPQLLDSDGVARFEAMRLDGTRFPLELKISRTSTDPLRITAWIHDRTRGARNEHQMSLAERVEAAVGAGSWEFDTTGDVVLFSDTLLRLFGYEPGEREPSVDFILEHVHPDDKEHVLERVDALVSRASSEPFEYRIFTKAGELIYLRITVAHSENAAGHQIVSGSARDVTAQRVAERRADFLSAIVDWTAEAAELPLRNDGVNLLLEKVAPTVRGLAASVWVPSGGVLKCQTTWSSDVIDGTGFIKACGEVELPPGAGLPGIAWRDGKTAYLKAGEKNDHLRARVMKDLGLSGGAAIPALSSSGVLAVVELLFREHSDATEEGAATARAASVLIGEFLSHRRGELETTTLTKREIQIVQLAAEGLSGPKIAERLVISPATVKSHFEHIYPKMKVSDRPAAVAEALRLGLIR